MHFFTVISGKKLLAGIGIVAGICVTAHAALAAVNDISVSVAERDLPIYSVERQEKVCSLTFDAAWGNDTMRKITRKESEKILIIARKAAVVPESSYKT